MRLSPGLFNLSRIASIHSSSTIRVQYQLRPLSSTCTRLSDSSKGRLTASRSYINYNRPNVNADTKPDNTQNPNPQSNSQSHQPKPNSNNTNQQPNASKPKTVSQSDAELRERLEAMSGEGGAAGIEYEDGQPNTMKRSVRNNMFRYI